MLLVKTLPAHCRRLLVWVTGTLTSTLFPVSIALHCAWGGRFPNAVEKVPTHAFSFQPRLQSLGMAARKVLASNTVVGVSRVSYLTVDCLRCLCCGWNVVVVRRGDPLASVARSIICRGVRFTRGRVCCPSCRRWNNANPRMDQTFCGVRTLCPTDCHKHLRASEEQYGPVVV